MIVSFLLSVKVIIEERKTGEQTVGGSVRTQRILVHTLSLTHVFFMCAA